MKDSCLYHLICLIITCCVCVCVCVCVCERRAAGIFYNMSFDITLVFFLLYDDDDNDDFLMMKRVGQ